MKLWICGTSNRKNDGSLVKTQQAQKQHHKSRGLLSGPKKSKVKEVSADDTTLSPRSDQTLDCSFETNRTPPKTKNVAFDLGGRDDSRVQQQSLVDDSNNTTSNTANNNDKFVDDSSSSRGSFSTSTPPKNRKKSSWFRPSAREAAFSGPPKYEWADVEATAAVKIQSVVRCVQTRDSLEHDEFTTAHHMRNRIRERKATNNAAWRRVITDDVPGMFRCCGVGLLFGDTQEETWITRDAQAKEAAKKKKLRQFQHEDELRENYMKQRPMEKWEFLEEDD